MSGSHNFRFSGVSGQLQKDGVPVNCRTLRDIIATEQIAQVDFASIDIEGFEIPVRLLPLCLCVCMFVSLCGTRGA